MLNPSSYTNPTATPSTLIIPHVHQARISRTNTIRAILLGELNLAFDGPGTEALVVGVVAGEVAVFPDAEFGVSAGVGDSFVLAHFGV